MDKQAGDLVERVEDERVAPRDDGTRERAERQKVARREEDGLRVEGREVSAAASM